MNLSPDTQWSYCDQAVISQTEEKTWQQPYTDASTTTVATTLYRSLCHLHYMLELTQKTETQLFIFTL